MNIRAKVMEKATEIKTKYGHCLITKVRILQNGEDIAIFSKLGDPIATSKTINQHLLIATNAKGKYQIVDNNISSKLEMFYTLNTELKFGKHKGKTVNQILQEDPSYIRWCLKNIDTFEMSDTDKDKVSRLSAEKSQQQYEDFYGAIDIYDYCD